MTLLRVIDLKQYVYCPRIVYYHQCLPRLRPLTGKMKLGLEAQEGAVAREKRRSLRRYGLERGERRLDVRLESAEVGLRGVVDLVIETDDNPAGTPEVIPVDYKLSTRTRGGQHFKMQLAAYGLLLEAETGRPARRGFLYYIPRKEAVEVRFTAGLVRKTRRAVRAMQKIVREELMPPPTKQRAKCQTCEFRRFCNDI